MRPSRPTVTTGICEDDPYEPAVTPELAISAAIERLPSVAVAVPVTSPVSVTSVSVAIWNTEPSPVSNVIVLLAAA